MKIFIVTSDKFKGGLEYVFNDDGYLVKYENQAQELNEEQQVFLLKNLPRLITELDKVKKQYKFLRVDEIKIIINFDAFWKRYFLGRGVDNSSKKRTEIKWNRMPKAEQTKAYNYINIYLSKIPQGMSPKYAETYLNSEAWNN